MNQSPYYRAGLEAAAGICRERLEYYVEEGCGCELNALDDCIERFGAAIEQSQPQEVQPVAWNLSWPSNGQQMVKDADVSVHQYVALGWKAQPLYTHPYDPAALTAAGFASVEDLLAAWQGAQKDAARLDFITTFGKPWMVQWSQTGSKPIRFRMLEDGEPWGQWHPTARQAIDAAIAAAPAPEAKP